MAMKEILVREKCSACGGTGFITHPPEEVPCPCQECDGRGYVMMWVDIATILREVRHA